MTLRLIEGLTSEALACTLSTRGGRNVGQQLVHVYEMRRVKVEQADKELAKDLPRVEREQGDDQALLLDVFNRSGNAIAEIIRRNCSGTEKLRVLKGTRLRITAEG